MEKEETADRDRLHICFYNTGKKKKKVLYCLLGDELKLKIYTFSVTKYY